MSEVIHVKHRGHSRNVEIAELYPELDKSLSSLSDAEIKQAVTNFLDIPANDFDDYVVDRHQTGNASIHPNAEFG